jgi:pimeloyl-ACP methyl ester carboxylesterase
VTALADTLESDLDQRGFEKVHLLGNSLGGRLALELARRRRAYSVVAIAPSGLSIPPERLYQVAGMAVMSIAIRAVGPIMPSLSKHRAARTALEAGLRARPWKATRAEVDALANGFGSACFWQLLWWAIAADVPANLNEINCPVLLLQGAGDWVAAGQTARFLPQIAGARFRILPWAGHAAQGDVPAHVARLVRENAAMGTSPHVPTSLVPIADRTRLEATASR